MSKKANITIKSNILVLDSEKPFTSKVLELNGSKSSGADKFIETIIAPSALKKIKKIYGYEKLSQMQKDILSWSESCSYAKNPPSGFSGVIRRDGKHYRVTRCVKIANCKYAEDNKCANETLLKNFP